jgi:hypothetical protein
MLTWRMVVIVASVNATPNAKMRTAKTNRRPICGLRTRSAHRDNALLERWFQWTVGRPSASQGGSQSQFVQTHANVWRIVAGSGIAGPGFIPGFLFEVRDASLSLGEERA